MSVTGKVAAILRTIGCRAELSLSDVARRTGLPLSTAHRLLKELVREQLVERTEAGRYRLWGAAAKVPMWAHGMPIAAQLDCAGGRVGGATCEVTAHHDALDHDDAMSVRALVCQTLDDLGQATGSQARFAVWSGTRISYIERSAGSYLGTCTTGLAQLPPHATAAGKALLAHTPAALLRRVVGLGLARYTELTITTVTDLESCLAAVRGNGLAVTWGELAPGRGAAATPVRGPDDLVVGALELSIDDLRELPGARACLFVAAPGLGRVLATRPAALPASDSALDWRADPTSPHLIWGEPEASNDLCPAQGEAEWRGVTAPLVMFSRDEIRGPEHSHPTQSEAFGQQKRSAGHNLLLADKPLHVHD